MGEAIKPEVGATVHKDGVTFRVWAPFASSVAVTGSFNDWSPNADPLTSENDGYWATTVGHAQIGQEYNFIIRNGDRELQRNDPRALQLTASGDASLIIDPNFDWEDDNFTIAPVNEQIVYELHIGTFHRTDPATPGTFETAAAKLDYLADLGINVIELMPVSNTTIDRWWGYDPDHLYAIDAAYGGRQAFLEFVKAAHKRGIGVVIDVVYNHLSPYPGMDLWQFDGWSENDKGGIYFYNDWRGDTPWGPRLDYGRPEVRQYITDNVRMWLRDCHVDGLRVDAVIAIRNGVGRNEDPSTDLPDGWRVLQELNTTAFEVKSEAMMIGEDIASNAWVTKPVGEGGAGFMAQWETSFPSILRNALNPDHDSDRHLQPIQDVLSKNYNGDIFQRVIYSESHDAAANGHQRLNEEISPGAADNLFARRRSALAAALVLTAPGIPMFFQGQEFMETGWFNHWKSLDWEKTEKFQGILQLYKDLIALRRNHDQRTSGLMGRGFDTQHFDEQSKVLAFHRWDQGGPRDDVIIAINFSNQQQDNYEIKFPQKGLWKVRFNSDWQGYSADFGNTTTPDIAVENASGAVNLGPYSVIILSQD
ncbi:MAG TPA: alpha-amylase family glycosyl hydrolase [Candidatus Saccharimonadia bacterium]